MTKKVIIFGGDGFCGWPSSLYLSKMGYEIIIVDNFSRRRIDGELGTASLTPISTLKERLKKWESLTNYKIRYFEMDVSKEYKKLLQLLINEKPDAIVHFAEQRAAPYSMMNSKTKIYTVENNLCCTHNILCAITESKLDIHVVHLGTMGVYGYGTAGVSIPEGYLKINLSENGKQLEIPYPPNPGSIYHMTKTQDALFFYFYNKNDGIRITDLHQGIVWGTNTEETSIDEVLINRFDYDGEYGTVLNRFLVQSILGFPLTVYGSGKQTRAFIHIKDTVKCIYLAIENPPAKGDRVKIFNQAAESHTLINLANKVCELTGGSIEYLTNPRNESAENELLFENLNFKKLGLDPIKLSDHLIFETTDIVSRYKNRFISDKIKSFSAWNHQRLEAINKE